MSITKIIQQLKEHLQRNLDYCEFGDGDTEHGFVTTIDFSMEDLWNEIDEFCLTFQHQEDLK